VVGTGDEDGVGARMSSTSRDQGIFVDHGLSRLELETHHRHDGHAYGRVGEDGSYAVSGGPYM